MRNLVGQKVIVMLWNGQNLSYFEGTVKSRSGDLIELIEVIRGGQGRTPDTIINMASVTFQRLEIRT